MSDKFTAGPWRIGTPGPNGCMTIGTEQGLMTAVIAHSINQNDQRETAQANARLIAAAPELLAALQNALSVIDDYLEYEHNGDPWTEDARAMGEMDIDDYKRDGRLDAVRALIAKATGGQP